MKRWIVCLLAALLFASISYTQQTQSQSGPGRMGRHVPPTFIHENSAGELLKEGGLKTEAEASERAVCPRDQEMSKIDVGQDLGYAKTDPNLPGYIKHYHEGLETKKNHVDTWATVVDGLEAHVKYCYYDDPDNNFIVIYLGPATEHKHPKKGSSN